MKLKLFFTGAVLAALFPLVSCVGAGADITIKRDGSGVINLEYRISRLAESLGKLDGNEGWPVIPVGRADFERTVARVQGLSLRSFNSKNEGRDMVNRVRLDFSNPEALALFLNPGSGGAGFSQANGKRRLLLSVPPAPADLDPELLDLFIQVSGGYAIFLNFTLPLDAEMAVLDGKGAPRSPPAGAELVSRGKRVSFTAPLEVLLADTGGLAVELRW